MRVLFIPQTGQCDWCGPGVDDHPRASQAPHLPGVDVHPGHHRWILGPGWTLHCEARGWPAPPPSRGLPEIAHPPHTHVTRMQHGNEIRQHTRVQQGVRQAPFAETPHAQKLDHCVVGVIDVQCTGRGGDVRYATESNRPGNGAKRKTIFQINA